MPLAGPGGSSAARVGAERNAIAAERTEAASLVILTSSGVRMLGGREAQVKPRVLSEAFTLRCEPVRGETLVKGAGGVGEPAHAFRQGGAFGLGFRTLEAGRALDRVVPGGRPNAVRRAAA